MDKICNSYKILVIFSLGFCQGVQINNFCTTSDWKNVECAYINSFQDLPVWTPQFDTVDSVILSHLNLSNNNNDSHLLNVFDVFVFRHATYFGLHNSSGKSVEKFLNSFTMYGSNQWPSLTHLNLSHNIDLNGMNIPMDKLAKKFPNLETLDVSHNKIQRLVGMDKTLEFWPSLQKIDISGNPLDCRDGFDWVIENGDDILMEPNATLCHLPSHQNKAKPILSAIRLINKVKNECDTNCTCEVVYIWEQNHEIFSKTAVNCSHLGWTSFPDPKKLPRPTDTLILSHNQIDSLKSFVENREYEDLDVMNLYLDNNYISDLNILQTSDWFYQFQVFSLRTNNITEVPVYVLENVMKENKRILHIDLSLNPFWCDCSTVSNFKVWLLRYAANIKNEEETRCVQTNEEIRYMRREVWCSIDDGHQLSDILDFVSILLALAIIGVVVKVYYDYWNFKRHGKLPWLVRKL